MDAIRAFIGIPLPPAYREALARLRRDLGPLAPARLGWTRPEAWHLTLKFLGDINASGEAGPAEIIEALSRLDWRAFPMRGGGAGYFPDALRPRVVWIGLSEGAKECAALAAKVEDALFRIGFAREKRPFSPHLTVARARQGPHGRSKEESAPARKGWKNFAAGLSGLSWPEFTVSRFTLWRSILGPLGPTYEPLAEWSARS